VAIGPEEAVDVEEVEVEGRRGVAAVVVEGVVAVAVDAAMGV
jgi:hypothetical protein